MCSSPIDRAAGSGTVRSDAYEPLQVAKELDGVRQETFSLPAMPKGSYGEVIKGPALRIEGTGHPLKLESSHHSGQTRHSGYWLKEVIIVREG